MLLIELTGEGTQLEEVWSLGWGKGLGELQGVKSTNGELG